MARFSAECVRGPHDGLQINSDTCPRDGDSLVPVGEHSTERNAIYVFAWVKGRPRWVFSHYETGCEDGKAEDD